MEINCITCNTVITNIKDISCCKKCDLYFCDECIDSIHTSYDNFETCLICRSSSDDCNRLHCMECNSILKTDKTFKKTIRSVETEVVELEMLPKCSQSTELKKTIRAVERSFGQSSRCTSCS